MNATRTLFSATMAPDMFAGAVNRQVRAWITSASRAEHMSRHHRQRGEYTLRLQTVCPSAKVLAGDGFYRVTNENAGPIYLHEPDDFSGRNMTYPVIPG